MHVELTDGSDWIRWFWLMHIVNAQTLSIKMITIFGKIQTHNKEKEREGENERRAGDKVFV